MGSTTPDPSNTNTPDPITLDKHLKPWQKASADVVLVAGGGTKFLCNAAVLASHSRVFESCIYGEDATKATPENPVVFEKAIAGKTLRELELLVGYLYAASPPVYVAKLPINSVLLLADMADEYHMDSLLQQCRVAVEGYVENTQVLKAHRGHDGVLKWTLIAQRFGFAKLLADCEYIIISHYYDLEKDPRMHELGSGSWQRIARGMAFAMMQGTPTKQRCPVHGKRHNCEDSCVHFFPKEKLKEMGPSAKELLQWAQWAQ